MTWKSSRSITREMDLQGSKALENLVSQKKKSLLKTHLTSLSGERENNKIIGYAIWHETSTDEHREGDPRDKEDKGILRRLLGGKKDFVELHEIWLMKEYRGRGYGKKFFDFFEEFMRNKGYDSIVYYADHPAALAICRKRGYKEDYLKSEAEYVFYIPLRKHTSQ